MERRRFTREFKLEAVRLIRDRGVPYAQASEGLKMHPTQLRNWVKSLSIRDLADQISHWYAPAAPSTNQKKERLRFA